MKNTSSNWKPKKKMGFQPVEPFEISQRFGVGGFIPRVFGFSDFRNLNEKVLECRAPRLQPEERKTWNFQEVPLNSPSGSMPLWLETLAASSAVPRDATEKTSMV